ncbi:unnamed protein product [Timema podura]|uniref:Arylsulfatase B n=1 Tax=Timema podura TaxID=61482 RepID=A0ABN7P1L8_TIMPD|nr:unnamed protein product [Timema podura]
MHVTDWLPTLYTAAAYAIQRVAVEPKLTPSSADSENYHWRSGREPLNITRVVFSLPGRLAGAGHRIVQWVVVELYSSGIPPLNGLDGVDQWDAIVYNLPSQRTEVLMNIDEKKRTAAIRFQNYKLIIGSSGAAFDKHFGETWTTSFSPPYNSSAITNSKAGTAIAELYRSLYRQATSALHLPYLRSEATLLCTPRNPGFSCDPAITKQSCLYDVEYDPCETDNIAETYPNIVQQLRGLLVRHRKSLVPQGNLPTVPFSANPSIWGDIWTNWGSGGEVG